MKAVAAAHSLPLHMRRRQKVVLDTDVASDLWRLTLDTSTSDKLANKTALLTYVTIAEWAQWVHHREVGTARTAALRRFSESFDWLWCDAPVVAQWGRLSDLSRRRGRVIPANDCWIAACCVVNGHPILTHNRKDFEPLEALGLTLL